MRKKKLTAMATLGGNFCARGIWPNVRHGCFGHWCIILAQVFLSLFLSCYRIWIGHGLWEMMKTKVVQLVAGDAAMGLEVAKTVIV